MPDGDARIHTAPASLLPPDVRGGTIDVDGNTYEDCRFERCVLRFSGEALPTFRRCRFVNADWQFVGAAATVVAFLSQIGQDFGPSGVELLDNLFQQIKQTRIVPTDSPSLIAEANVGDTGPVMSIDSSLRVRAGERGGSQCRPPPPGPTRMAGNTVETGGSQLRLANPHQVRNQFPGSGPGCS